MECRMENRAMYEEPVIVEVRTFGCESTEYIIAAKFSNGAVMEVIRYGKGEVGLTNKDVIGITREEAREIFVDKNRRATRLRNEKLKKSRNPINMLKRVGMALCLI